MATTTTIATTRPANTASRTAIATVPAPGNSDSERGRRFKFKNDDWEDSRGYEHWMGNHGNYKRAYREGYERGYRRAYGYEDGRYRDRDDYRRQIAATGAN